jgi:REP element-mobilizing transposase RayT
MARPLRLSYPGAVYHITSRGNEKKPVFKDNNDRMLFLYILRKVKERYNWFYHAYCLMDNHYHLIVETPDGNISIGMRQINGVYTQAFNRCHNRVGHLFQGRYKAILLQKESHLLEVCRYVVLNPVRAHLVKEPEQWKWSSYRATAGKSKPHVCLTVDWVLGQFSTRRQRAEKAYREFVKAGVNKDAVLKHVKAQSLLGKEDFVDSLRGYLKGYKDISEIPKSQRYMDRPELEEIFGSRVVQDRKRRDRKISESVIKYGYTQREIANYLGMHFSSISRLLRT